MECDAVVFKLYREREAGSGWWWLLLLIPTFCLALRPNAVCFDVIFSRGMCCYRWHGRCVFVPRVGRKHGLVQVRRPRRTVGSPTLSVRVGGLVRCRWLGSCLSPPVLYQPPPPPCPNNGVSKCRWQMWRSALCKSSRSSGAGPGKFTPSWPRSRSPYIGSPLNVSYAEFFRFMLQFLCLQMCVSGGSAVPQGGWGTVTW